MIAPRETTFRGQNRFSWRERRYGYQVKRGGSFYYTEDGLRALRTWWAIRAWFMAFSAFVIGMVGGAIAFWILG